MALRALRMMLWQLLVILGLSAAVLLIQGAQTAFSVLLGGLCYWLPTLVFATRIFKFATARQAKQFVAAFFVGEMLKLMLSAILFVFSAKYLPVMALAMMVGYMGAIVAFWVVGGLSLMER
jgi:ATP synthase protein I